MWKYSLLLLAMLAVVFTAFGCGDSEIIKARLDEEFALAIGQRASITGEELEIKFRDVTGDSRCPSNVTCVWAGQVTCAVEVKKAGSSSQMILTQSGLTSEYAKATYQDYELAFNVTPYPEAGTSIDKSEYRLYLIVSKLPQLTNILGNVLAEPQSLNGKNITIIGYYRGWDLLHEANVSPPVTRSDWVIKDSTGAVYVSANSEAGIPDGLYPTNLEDTDVILAVKGVVHITEAGQPYIEATSIERLY